MLVDNLAVGVYFIFDGLSLFRKHYLDVLSRKLVDGFDLLIVQFFDLARPVIKLNCQGCQVTARRREEWSSV